MKNVKDKIASLAVLPLLFACSSEPRTMPYFEKNIDEARELIADTDICLGPDQTKIFAGTDECTNAHLAIKKIEAAEYNQQRKKANDDAFKEGRFLPVLKN